MNKKYFCVFLAVLLLLSLLSPVSAFAANSLYCPNCGSVQLQGVITQHNYCPKCGCYLYTTGGSFRGGGAGRLETGKKYYTAPSDSGSGNLYNSGGTSYYSIVNQQNKTINYTSYNSVTNKYVNNRYSYSTYNYDTTYNYYTYTTNNNTNYYVSNFYTYVVISYPSSTNTPDAPSYNNIVLYYQLPDGRNSSELTVDDVWGQYFIYDAVNYKEVLEDDGTTLALYHLDGDYSDSSANASPDIPKKSYLSFTDAFFDGGLILSETTRRCDFEIPIPDGHDYYTVEFRIKYLSGRIDPNRSPLNNGEITGFYLFNSLFRDHFPAERGYFDCNYGVWYSIAIVCRRSNNVVNLYVNGARVSIDGSNYWIMPILTETGLIISNDTGIEAYGNDGTGPWMYYGFSSFIIDEIRVSNKALYTTDYSPSSQPYDTNSVLVLPAEGSENQIAVKSNIPVSGFRVGGVRPTYPLNGYVYVYLEDNVVKDVQQYQNNGWQSVDAAIYLDGEWKSLKDTDLSDYGNDEESPSTPSPSPSPSPAPGEPTPSPSDNPAPTLPPSTPETGDGDGNSDLNGLINMILSLLNGLGDLFAAVISGLFSLFESLLTMASGFSEFLTASFGYLPADVLNVLGAGVVLMIVLAVIKFIRG